MIKRIFFSLACFGVAVSQVQGGEMQWSGFFTDNMVLQSNAKVPVWGYSEPGTGIELSLLSVIFNEDGLSILELPPYSGKAEDSGAWRININPTAPGSRAEIFVRTDSGHIAKIEDVVFGDVFLFIGGAEMERKVVSSAEAVSLLKSSRIGDLRLLKIKDDWAAEPQTGASGEWKRSNPRNAAVFSQIAYTCGAELCRQLNYPVGVIAADFAGAPVSAWLSMESFSGAAQEYIGRYKPESVELGKLKAEFGKESEVKAADTPPFSPEDPAVLFNAMIAPVTPAALKAVVWYPENVADKWLASPAEQIELMVENLRSAFNNPELPVFIILSGDEALAAAQRAAAEKLPDIFIIESSSPDATGGAVAEMIMAKLYNGDEKL